MCYIKNNDKKASQKHISLLIFYATLTGMVNVMCQCISKFTFYCFINLENKNMQNVIITYSYTSFKQNTHPSIFSVQSNIFQHDNFLATESFRKEMSSK